MRFSPGANVARVDVAEVIGALWTFAHAQGLLTDDIGERTAAEGVTIDGVLLIDGRIDELLKALASTVVIRSNVVGDGDIRFRLDADGFMQWGDGVSAADVSLFRDAANVLKTGDSMEIAGALGAIVDIITEISSGNGVVIDGARLKDGGLTSQAFPSGVAAIVAPLISGDSIERLNIRGDGEIQIGDGASGRDVITRRSGTNEMTMEHALVLEGSLDLAADLELSERSFSLGVGESNNVDSGSVTVQRITADAGGSQISGFAGGVAGRVIVISQITSSVVTLEHNDVGSSVGNRMFLPNNVDIVLVENGSVILFYDGTSNGWRVHSETN